MSFVLIVGIVEAISTTFHRFALHPGGTLAHVALAYATLVFYVSGFLQTLQVLLLPYSKSLTTR